MKFCPECLSLDEIHLEGCKLDPARKRTQSRRDFLKTAGILGAAILVAPSLLLKPKPNAIIFSIDFPSQFVWVQRNGITTSSVELQKVWRKVQGKAMVGFHMPEREWEISDAPKSLYSLSGGRAKA